MKTDPGQIIHNRSILLLDDDDDDCVLFQDALQEIDSITDLTTLSSCQQLMTTLSQPNTLLPDLIVMDLNMPKQNGFECLTGLKENEKLKNVPVVILSTSSHPEAIDLVLNRGALHYVVKPYTFSVMTQIVRRLLSLDLRMARVPQSRDKFLMEF